MKRTLLTGAGGAIGCHVLAHIMHNTDWELVALDSFVNEHKGYYDRITEICRHHPDWWKRIVVFQHDLTAPITHREEEEIGHIDYILNLAARSDVQNSIDDPIPFCKNNVDIALNILEYARRIKPEVFLQFSTDEVYGPTYRDSGGHKEWDTILPSNPYAASKAAQECFSIAWWRSFGVPLIMVNIMNNFGEMQSPSKFPAMIQKKLAKDEPIQIHASRSGEVGTRFYLHSRNTADALIFILKNVPPVPHVFGEQDKPVRLNVVGDKQVSNIELVEVIGKLMGKKPKIEMCYFHENNPGHDLHYGLNGEKLEGLGWRSPMSFEDSLKKTIDWQKDNPRWL